MSTNPKTFATKKVEEQVSPQAQDNSELRELKADLQRALNTLDEMHKAQSRMEEELLKARAEAESAKSAVKAEGQGWLITTPSSIYDETTLGIKFSNGAAWISANGNYPAGVLPNTPQVEKDALMLQAKKGRLAGADEFDQVIGKRAEGQLALIEKREKRTPAEVMVELLTKDFGYKATWYDGKNSDELKKVLDLRALQAREDEERLNKAREEGEKFSQPMIMR